MDREISVEEKIRRAEDIYRRRNGIQVNNESKKKSRPIKRLFSQIMVCFLIYAFFYIIHNSSYIFSEDFLNRTREIFSKNINIGQMYDNVKNSFINKSGTESEENVENITENQEEKTSNTINTEESRQTETENLSKNNENIGGAENTIDFDEGKNTNNQDEKSQEELDVEYIKNNVNFITPIYGQISSTFGWRTPTSANVPKYHTGLDIAVNTGTPIKSATDGMVILSSSEGDYGKHLEIEIGELLIVYAHCNKLYLSKGDVVKQGQEIAEVGSTGNSTGPHLHFEIRRQGRYIDPQLIIDV